MDITYVCIIIGVTKKKLKLNVSTTKGPHTEKNYKHQAKNDIDG